MPWPKFADWIGMGDEPRVVESWVQRGYLPTKKVGKRVMINVALLVRQLLEEE
ncbi:DNA-binding protein [Halopseudomonas sp.]